MTAIAGTVMMVASFNGINTLLSLIPSLMDRYALVEDTSYWLALFNSACTLIPMLLVDLVGRRRLLLMGASGMAVGMLFLGVLSADVDFPLPTIQTAVVNISGNASHPPVHPVGPAVDVLRSSGWIFFGAIGVHVLAFSSCWGGVDWYGAGLEEEKR